MEKILMVIDGTDLNTRTLDFACYLAELTHSAITGIFLENHLTDEKLIVQEMYDGNDRAWQTDKAGEAYRKKKEAIEHTIHQFKKFCERRSIRYSVHRDNGEPGQDIIDESRCADIIVVDAETSFHTGFESIPSAFLKDIFTNAECPVIIAPEAFEGIAQIVFTYDGSKSSMFAIKQFTHLFPQFNEKNVQLLEIEDGVLVSAEKKEQLKEWMISHYSCIGFETIKGDAETELLDHLLKKKNVFIVMGAYGRNMLSMFFRRSRAEVLIRTIVQPVFIAHY